MNALEYFTTNEWTFKNENFKQLMQSLDKKDFVKFSMDIQSINWCEYIENYVLGVRKYLLKEEPRTLPKARANLKRLYLISQMMKLGLLASAIYLMINKQKHSKLFNTLKIKGLTKLLQFYN